jgi:hypothetical protein
MTVQKELTKNIYVGNGQTTKFPVTFEYPDNHPEYIKVYVTGKNNKLTETTNFSVDMTNKAITYPANGEPLAADEQLVIMRELPVRQLMNLVNNGPFFAEDIETAFDEAIMTIQQISEKLKRTITMSVDIDGDAFVNEVPFEAGKSFRIADDGKSIVLTEDPGKVIDEAKGLAEETATNAQEAKQAAAEIKTIYNSGGLTPITDLAGSIGTAIKRWGYIFANKVFAMNLPIVYKSVAEMKADSLLFAGMTACTLGYYAINDGGAGTYIIRAKQESDVDDGGSLHELTSGLVAELVVENGTANTIQLGLSKTDEHGNNLKKLGNAINKGFKVIITDIYNINSGETQYLKNDLFVKGKSKECGFVFNGAPEYLFRYCHEAKSIDISFLTFKNQKESRVTLFYENSNENNMVDMDLFSCCDCVFLGNVTLQRQNYINRIYNDSEQLPRINSVIINDNIIRDCPSSFCQCADTCFEKFEIQRNSVRNFKYLLFNIANTNLPDDASDAWKDKHDRLFSGMKNLIVKNNHTVNDDDCVTQNTISGTDGYHAFVAAETQMVEFSGNYTEGLKAETLAVYDAYLSCKDVVYTDNVWKNNMQYKSNLNCTLIKCKEGGGLRTYSNNNFVLDNEFINMLVNKYGAKKEDCYVELCSLVSPVEIQINNNFFDIAQLIFFQSNYDARLYTFSNNIMELNNVIASYLTTCPNGSKTVFTNNIINIKNITNGNMRNLSLVNPAGIQDITFCNNKITVTNGGFYQEDVNMTSNSSFKNNELRFEDGVFFDNLLFYEDSLIKTKALRFSKTICKNFDYQNSYKLIGKTLTNDYCVIFLNHELSYVLFFDVIIYNRETAKKTITSFSLKHYFENEQEKLILNMPDGTTKEYDFSVSSWVNVLSDLFIIECAVVNSINFSLSFKSNSVDYFDFALKIKYVYLK